MPGTTAPRSRPGGCLVFAFALGGLLLGHGLAYLIAVPDPYHRDLLLQRTGHGYLPTLIEAALVLLLAGTASLVGRNLRRGPSREPGIAVLASRLAVLQVVAFVGQEIAERVIARVPLAALGHDDVFALGLVMQLGIAVLGALALRWLVRVSNRVPELIVAPPAVPRRAVALPIAPPVRVAIPLRPLLAFAMRAPPRTVSSPA